MIQLTNQTTVALLLALMKQNYGKAWYSNGDREGYFVAGLHLPTGEIAYYLPSQYWEYMQGMILLSDSDLQDKSTETDASDRLLKWVTTL